MFHDLLQSSITLNIQYYGSQAFHAVVSLLGKIEHAGIGETRAFVRNPKATINSLIVNARESESGAYHISLGYLGGNYAVITPKSHEDFVSLLNQIDEEPSSRKGYVALRFFSGTDFLIPSETGHKALVGRKNLSQFLRPALLAAPTIRAIDNSLASKEEIKTHHTICDIIRSVMLKEIIGIGCLPENTYDLLKAYREDTKTWTAHPFPQLLNFLPSQHHKRKEYNVFCKGLLEPEFQKLAETLRTSSDPEKVNFITASVISAFKRENPNLNGDEVLDALKELPEEKLRRYFDDPTVQSLPMLAKAIDSLIDAITVCLEEIAADPEKLEMLREEIDRSGVMTRELDLSTLKSLPLLDAFYKETLRFDTPAAITRYTKRGCLVGSMVIPPHTMMLIDLKGLSLGEKHWENPNEFDPMRFLNANATRKIGQFPLTPFSVGERKCPAFAVTESLFKVVIAKFTVDYELKLVKKDEDDSTLHISSRNFENSINPTSVTIAG